MYGYEYGHVCDKTNYNETQFKTLTFPTWIVQTRKKCSNKQIRSKKCKGIFKIIVEMYKTF